MLKKKKKSPSLFQAINLLLQWLSPLKFFITQISLFTVHANLSFKLVPPHNQYVIWYYLVSELTNYDFIGGHF